MKTTNKQYAQVLHEIVKDLSDKELESAVVEFIKLLYKDHKLKSADRIINEFVKYAKKQAGIMDIEITSARKLDDQALEQIKNIFGKETESVEKIDDTLLGGVKIKTDTVIFDGSLKTQLIKLKQVFNN